MNKVKQQILENLFDSLDRLFDKECKAIDVYFLIYASEKALGAFSPIISLQNYSTELEKIVTSGKSEEFQREEALTVTNNLRTELDEMLPI